MDMKVYAAGLCAAAIAVAAIAVPAVEAAPKKKQYVYTTARVAPANRPRARVVVAPRSFLDAGTEVLPGERKFTDYAFPPTYYPMQVIDNHAGFHRSPLPGPFYLPSRNNPVGW